MKSRITALLFTLTFCTSLVMAQNATVRGKVVDKKGLPVELATVSVFGFSGGTNTDASGSFQLEVIADSAITVYITHIAFGTQKFPVKLAAGEQYELNVKLESSAKEIGSVIIEDKETRRTTLKRIDPKLSGLIPTAGGGIESLLKTLPGVSSNNELSSQYNVRGGNYDENLVYVNDIEVYRPFLVRSGQQEGLSFINSDLVGGLLFSAGGFDAKYGDKMSSVLDIQYKKPRTFGGSVTASILGGAAHLEGASKNTRLTYLTGARFRTSQYLLNSLDTKGEYKPAFTDWQSFVTYSFSPEFEINVLTNIAKNTYHVVPETRETDYGTLNEALRLTVYFDGNEKDEFYTQTGAISSIYKPNDKTTLKFIGSAFQTKESETFDILGAYRLNELETDFGKETFGDTTLNRGVGAFLNHARNYLDATVYNAEHRGSKRTSRINYEWGAKYQHEIVHDKLSEWRLIDSSEYSIPQGSPDIVEVQDLVRTKVNLNSNRYTGYFQDTWSLNDSIELFLTTGVRFHYWDVNKQFLVSPRATISYKPKWKRVDMLFRISGGYYYQPPFYREIRDLKGVVHKDVKAQESIHFVTGVDYNLRIWNRPFKLIAEGYYKELDNLIPYEIDNVRIRYYAKNMAHGYAQGIDLKLNGEFVKGIESWASVSLMQTKEDIEDDYYDVNFNKSGEPIYPGYTFDDSVYLSLRFNPGYIPRPTNQLLNFAIFFQDYLPKLPSLRMNLSLVFGSPLPFGPPDFQRYKDILKMPPYRRVDIGFSYILKSEEKELKKSNPFHVLKSAWISAEVLNLLQVSNTVSYIWIQDVTARQYAIPNYLTDRLINIKLVTHF